jgi:hypothetical protein
LSLPETELVLDAAGRVVDAEPAETSYPHTIIEMFMVEANEAVARLLEGLGVPFLRRAHDEPDEASLEGLAKMLRSFLTDEFKRNWFTYLCGIMAVPVLNAFKRRVDPGRYNGASLLGLKGIVVKSHGSADSFAFQNAVERAFDEVREDVLQRISQRLAAAGHSTAAAA